MKKIYYCLILLLGFSWGEVWGQQVGCQSLNYIEFDNLTINNGIVNVCAGDVVTIRLHHDVCDTMEGTCFGQVKMFYSTDNMLDPVDFYNLPYTCLNNGNVGTTSFMQTPASTTAITGLVNINSGSSQTLSWTTPTTGLPNNGELYTIYARLNGSSPNLDSLCGPDAGPVGPLCNNDIPFVNSFQPANPTNAIRIRVNPNLSISGNPNNVSICDGDDATIVFPGASVFGSGTNLDVEYNINGNNTTTASMDINNSVYSFDVPNASLSIGSNTINITEVFNNATGCNTGTIAVATTVTVSVLPSFANLSPQSTCEGEPLRIDLVSYNGDPTMGTHTMFYRLGGAGNTFSATILQDMGVDYFMVPNITNQNVINIDSISNGVCGSVITGQNITGVQANYIQDLPSISSINVDQTDPICLNEDVLVELLGASGITAGNTYEVIYRLSTSNNSGPASYLTDTVSLTVGAGNPSFTTDSIKQSPTYVHVTNIINNSTGCESELYAFATKKTDQVAISTPVQAAMDSQQKDYCAGETFSAITIDITNNTNGPWEVYYNSGSQKTILSSGDELVPANQVQALTYSIDRIEDNSGCVYLGSSFPQLSITQKESLQGLRIVGDPTRTICEGQTIELVVKTLNGNTFSEDVEVEVLGRPTGTLSAGLDSVVFSVGPNNNRLYTLSSAKYTSNPECEETQFTGGNTTLQVIVRNKLDDVSLVQDGKIRKCHDEEIELGVVFNSDSLGSTDAIAMVGFPDGSTRSFSLQKDTDRKDTTFLPGVKGSYGYKLQSLAYTSGPDCRVTEFANNTVDSLTIRVLQDMSKAVLIGDTTCQANTGEISLKLPAEDFSIVARISPQIGSKTVQNPGIVINTYTSNTLSDTGFISFRIDSIKYQVDAETPKCLTTQLDSGEAKILVLEKPTPKIGALDPAYCVNELVVFQNETTPAASREGYPYVWRFGSSSADTTSDVNGRHVYRTEEEYKVLLTTFPRTECASSDSVMINISGTVAPPNLYKIKKAGADGAALVAAYDDAATNDSIAKYIWLYPDFSPVTDVAYDSTEAYIFFPDSTKADGVMVEVEINGNTSCGNPVSLPARTSSVAGLDPQMTLFPNPSQGTFTIEIEGPIEGTGTLQIVDLMGRVVYQVQAEKTVETLRIKVNPNLSAGHYLVQFGLPGYSTLHQRLVIQ